MPRPVFLCDQANNLSVFGNQVMGAYLCRRIRQAAERGFSGGHSRIMQHQHIDAEMTWPLVEVRRWAFDDRNHRCILAEIPDGATVEPEAQGIVLSFKEWVTGEKGRQPGRRFGRPQVTHRRHAVLACRVRRKPSILPEQRQDHLRRGIRDAEGLHRKLLFHLQGLQPGRLFR